MDDARASILEDRARGCQAPQNLGLDDSIGIPDAPPAYPAANDDRTRPEIAPAPAPMIQGKR